MSKRNKGGQRPNADNGNGGSVSQSDSTGSAEGVAPEGEGATAEAVDPFADIPTVTVGEGDSVVEFADFTDTPTSDPRKYASVAAAAVAERLPTVKGWKHEGHMLVPGSQRKEFKQGSVYGDIQQIVQAAGRGGIPAYVVATMLRRRQIGNKRSHYCTGLPPIGWAEGWINTAITKNIAGVHPTKAAPAIRSEVTEGEANAQKKLANG